VLGLVYAKAVGTRLHIVSVDSKTNNVAMRLIEEADTHIHISESEAQKICKSEDISVEIKEYYDSLSDDAKTQLSSLNPWSLP
jgi:hypothetical protein